MSTTRVTSGIVVDAPPHVVFAILADPRQHPRIDGSGMLRGAVTGPQRLDLGSRFGMDMKQGASYRITNRVVEFEPDRLIAWRHVGPHRWRYELHPTAGGRATKVTETWDISSYPRPARAVLRLLAGARTQRAVDATLVLLKEAAEADANV